MAIPRVFISSTYYDLRHMRSSIERFVQSMGFEAILSEKGSIAYSPDVPLDQSCYRDAETADILVIIVGGRYGSGASSNAAPPTGEFFERYDSITKKELEAAVRANVPVYIAVDRSVYAEYETFLRNRANMTVSYAHVQNVNVFELLDQIVKLPKNNPILQFDRPVEVEDWLRKQWAGLFGDMLRTRSERAELASLAEQVGELAEVNKTLKTYMEEVVKKVSKGKGEQIVVNEQKRLVKAANERASPTSLLRYFRGFGITPESIIESMQRESDDWSAYVDVVVNSRSNQLRMELADLSASNVGRARVRRDFGALRQLLLAPTSTHTREGASDSAANAKGDLAPENRNEKATRKSQ